MNLQEINKKIAEYRMYLENAVGYEPIRNGVYMVKKKTVSKDLIKFYRAEIGKLETERQIILQREQVHHIKWDHVFFGQNEIKVKFNSQFSLAWNFPQSKRSFEHIKTYLTKSILPPLKVVIRGNKILRIDNLEYFSQAVEILNFKRNIDLYLRESGSRSIGSVINGLEKISNKAIREFLNLNDRSQYLSHLCNIQSTQYKIIPAPELFIFSNNLKEEDTFIFTVCSAHKLLLVWESINVARATYIFEVDVNSYRDKLETIFEYIVSTQKNKRSSLRGLIPQTDTIKVIQHDDFEDWKKKIEDFSVPT